MAPKLEFVKIATNFQGLVLRAWNKWIRFLPGQAIDYTLICIQDGEIRARCLDFLAQDLPESELTDLVRRMPYLLLIFQTRDKARDVPLDSLFAFVSVLNLSGVATLMRQISDRPDVAEFLGVDADHWRPVMFISGGQPDVDRPTREDDSPGCTFL